MTDTELASQSPTQLNEPSRTRGILFSVFNAPRSTALIYLVALVLAEAMTTLIEPRVGLVMHGLILVALLLHASLGARLVQRRFLLCLAMAPLIRLLSLSLPLPEFSFVYWYLVVGVPLFISAYLVARAGKMSKGMLGLTTRGWPLQLLVGLTGIALGYIEYLILDPAPLIPELSLSQIIIPALILFIFTGFLEELIFRGMLQYASIRSLRRIGIYFVAVVFAVLHLGYLSAIDLLFVFVVALFFGWITIRTGSILGVSIAHGLTNIGLYLIFPLILVAPAAIPGSPAPIQVAPQPGLLAPQPTGQATRPWLPPTATPLPSASPTVTACQPPESWVIYTVQDSDTLSSISVRVNISPGELQTANCLTTDALNSGQALYVPFVPTPTATPFSPPTQTVRPTRTQAPATAPVNQAVTPVPTRTRRPTNANIPPTNTAAPPTETPLPPTQIPIPPTATSAPPSNTLEPTPTGPPPIEPTPTDAPSEPPLTPTNTVGP